MRMKATRRIRCDQATIERRLVPWTATLIAALYVLSTPSARTVGDRRFEERAGNPLANASQAPSVAAAQENPKNLGGKQDFSVGDISLVKVFAQKAPTTQRPNKRNPELAARARRIEKAILSKCVLPDGYFVWYTMRPKMQDARRFIRAGKWPNWPNGSSLPDHFKLADHAEFGAEVYHLYEDSNYAAGKFLTAMAYRYAASEKATEKAEAAKSARLAFRALCEPFDWAVSVNDPGFFPKPYGGLSGWFATREGYHETSLDQTIAPSYGLWEFSRKVGTQEERARVLRYLQLQGHWWIKNRYTYIYGGAPRLAWPAPTPVPAGSRVEFWTDPAKPYRSQVFKLLMPMHVAAKALKDEALMLEVKTKMRQAMAAGTLPLQDQYMPETKDYNQWAHAAAYFMDESDIADRAYWLKLIDGYWRAGKSTLMPAVGLSLAMGQFNAIKWRLEPYQPGKSSDPQWGFQGAIPSPTSSCENAWLALLAYELGLDDDAPQFARGILEKLDETNLSEIWDPENNLPPDIRWRSQIIPTEGLGIWLAAYWKGRLLDVW